MDEYTCIDEVPISIQIEMLEHEKLEIDLRIDRLKAKQNGIK